MKPTSTILLIYIQLMALIGFSYNKGRLKSYEFDSFGVENPPIVSEKYVDLGSNERIQEYDESYAGADCLYMIYLIDRRFIIEGALDILVNQVKCPKMYDMCFCFSCKVKGEVEVDVNEATRFADDNDNQGNCFAVSMATAMTMLIM